MLRDPHCRERQHDQFVFRRLLEPCCSFLSDTVDGLSMEDLGDVLVMAFYSMISMLKYMIFTFCYQINLDSIAKNNSLPLLHGLS